MFKLPLRMAGFASIMTAMSCSSKLALISGMAKIFQLTFWWYTGRQNCCADWRPQSPMWCWLKWIICRCHPRRRNERPWWCAGRWSTSYRKWTFSRWDFEWEDEPSMEIRWLTDSVFRRIEPVLCVKMNFKIIKIEENCNELNYLPFWWVLSAKNNRLRLNRERIKTLTESLWRNAIM